MDNQAISTIITTYKSAQGINMETTIDPELKEVISAVHYRPALSIILPIKANINMKEESAYAFKIVEDKAKTELEKYYPSEQCKLIMDKLKTLLHDLEVPAYSKGLAIYISPVFEKAIFLDTPVQEKVIVDESFRIRDVLYNTKQQDQFILLVFNSAKAKIYLIDSNGLTKFPASTLSIDKFINDAPEKVGNFSDAKVLKQTSENKFLRHIDTELDSIHFLYHLPIIVLTTEKLIGHYKKLTHHSKFIIDYLRGYEDDLSSTEIKELIAPHLNAWKLMQQNSLFKRLDEAASQKLLIYGIKEIWQKVSSGACGLLVLEQNYQFAAQHGPNPEVIEEISEPYNQLSYIRDAVDDVIEMVLKNGGDVAFVADDSLLKFNHIAFISSY